jgi:2-iminobutanoate/2-iminopropanoate deaminase
MAARRSISVAGLDHGDSPFPVATRVGPYIYSSALSGRNPDTGELDSDIATQAAQAFDNVERVVTAAGGQPGSIVKVVVFARDRAATRAVIDAPWTALFPDPDSRPVRHTIEAALPAGMHLQVEFIAIQEN